MSGPYPPDIQQKIMRSMLGLGAVEIVRPGYDVEYDFVNPTCLTHTLETKKIGGLYLAGQICGTTGYEEAAAQGIVAGANAGRAAVAAASGEKGALPFVVGRDEGYIGVLIDDLVTRGTLEPYRMFTSRAEYRISLRADNADMRLTRKGVDFSLVVDEERISALYAREDLLDNCLLRLKSFEMKVVDWAEKGGAHLMGGAQMVKRIGSKKTAADVLGMPLVTLKDVEDIMVAVDGLNMTRSPKAVADTVEATIKYNSYAIRQQRDMNSWRRAQGVRIPPDVAYTSSNFPCLSNEELEKLDAVRPNTFADASQISGITPQSLIYLHHYVNDRIRKRDGDQRTSKKQTVQVQ
jgi:tRNA uridine 5-carboxymethylaminomethyl modification enzyme